ncbi:nodulin-26-like [Vicia villosa]|uniref:nodulin-26-like n=1 Tax=Vicia villosa TaxID=3911 RepID=UPI00273C6414|nr:nodulin-26-like [Vicia villosa]
MEDPVSLTHKLVVEMVGTFYFMFVGFGITLTNIQSENGVAPPAIAIVWGLIVVALVYCLGHISGGHFNPVVIITQSLARRIPKTQVPIYILAQHIGSKLAFDALKFIFGEKESRFLIGLPADSNLQAFLMEFIITFFLMLILSRVSTSNRAIGELVGFAVGTTIILSMLFVGPFTRAAIRASMNPTERLSSTIVHHEYKDLESPILGTLAGSLTYTFFIFTNKLFSSYSS